MIDETYSPSFNAAITRIKRLEATIVELRVQRDELVAALVRLVTDWGDGCDPTDSDCLSTFADARAAIAKAKEQQT